MLFYHIFKNEEKGQCNFSKIVLPRSLKNLAQERLVYGGNIFEHFIYLSLDGSLPPGGGGAGGGAALWEIVETCFSFLKNPEYSFAHVLLLDVFEFLFLFLRLVYGVEGGEALLEHR